MKTKRHRNVRRRVPELMDDPALDAAAHVQALRSLARLNRWAAAGRILWAPIRALASANGHGRRPLRVLDVATGGGDIPIGLARRARAAGLPVEFAGCDISPRAVDCAAQQAARAQAPVRFFVHDVLRGSLPGDYDVVMCSLFLHHLADGDAVRLLAAMRHAARQQVLVSDLERSSAGYALTLLATKLLSRSAVVKTDGPRSVRAAFTLSEANQLARRADLNGCTVRRRWPFRYLLTWRRP